MDQERVAKKRKYNDKDVNNNTESEIQQGIERKTKTNQKSTSPK